MSFILATLIAVQLVTVEPRGKTSTNCFIETLCAVKEKVRWPKGDTTKWSYEKCQGIGRAFLEAGEKYEISPALLVAIAINESELDEKALAVVKKNDQVYAYDVGMTQTRCVVGKNDKCLNGYTKGRTVAELLRPAVNIDTEAKILASIKKDTSCKHTTHPWWAHYNWGARVFNEGTPRNYPHRIAVLFNAFAQASGGAAPELQGQVNSPIGARAKKLYAQVLSCSGACTVIAEPNMSVMPATLACK